MGLPQPACEIKMRKLSVATLSPVAMMVQKDDRTPVNIRNRVF
jgi:hypothetical protein